MDWFNGDVSEAVQKCGANDLLLVVFIGGKDDTSKSMLEAFNSTVLIKAVKAVGHVALKVDADSITCKQFSQIYPVLCIPSAYFISPSGILLEAVAAISDSQQLKTHVEKAVMALKNAPAKTAGEQTAASTSKKPVARVSPAAASSTSSDSPASSAAEAAPLENTSAKSEDGLKETDDGTKPDAIEKVVEQEEAGDSPSKPVAEAAAASTTNTKEAPKLEDRVALAKEKMRQVQLAKAEKAKEEEREKEIERRQVGQGATHLRQWQEEREREEVVKGWKKQGRGLP